MPRPVQARPSSPSLSPPKASVPPHSTLIHDATVSSTQFFTQQAASVLKHSSSSFLKRRLSQKLHDQLIDVPDEALKNCDAASVISTLCHPPLEISEQDVVDCEAFAQRVGYRWAKVLRQRGYVEFADVLLNLVEEGNFLEGSTNDRENPKDAETAVVMNEDTDENDSLTNKFLTPYAALRSLRRYPPDCDASGRPFEHIPTLSGRESNGMSSARRVIRQIDRLMQSMDSKVLKARYGYDWDAINEAVKRNEKRLYIYQRSADHQEDEYEVVPKIFSQKEDTAEDSDSRIRDSETLHREMDVRFKEGLNPVVEEVNHEAVNTEFLISTHPKTASVIRRKRYREEYNQNSQTRNADASSEIQKGRPPSTIAETHWAWEDILGEFTISERQKLIKCTVHPPFPPIGNGDEGQIDVEDISEKENFDGYTDGENGKNSATDVEAHSAVICGALRSFGATHLWEQTWNFPLNHEQRQTREHERQHRNRLVEDTVHGAIEARTSFQSQHLLQLQKRTLRRAIKERTAPRSLILSDMKSEYSDRLGKNNKSKVKWTEGYQCNGSGRQAIQDIDEDSVAGLPTHQLATSTVPSNIWLEMDLGECTIEIADDDDNGETQGEEKKPKRVLAFRSLEMALRF